MPFETSEHFLLFSSFNNFYRPTYKIVDWVLKGLIKPGGLDVETNRDRDRERP